MTGVKYTDCDAFKNSFKKHRSLVEIPTSRTKKKVMYVHVKKGYVWVMSRIQAYQI